MKISKIKSSILFLALALVPLSLGAEDIRRIPLDMYVIIDGSAALKNARQEALTWFSEQIIDRLLRDGDRLSVWIAADRAELVFSDTLKGPEDRETLRERLNSAGTQGQTADFAGALREAAARTGPGRGSLPPYTLLITGASGGLFPSLEGNADRLLRYSRVEEFPGWRALQAAFDIGGQVQGAAAAYLRPGN